MLGKRPEELTVRVEVSGGVQGVGGGKGMKQGHFKVRLSKPVS